MTVATWALVVVDVGSKVVSEVSTIMPFITHHHINFFSVTELP